MCITDRHDMTLAVKVALNPNTTNQSTKGYLSTKQNFVLEGIVSNNRQQSKSSSDDDFCL